jgi:hypothetical protein
MQTPDYRVANLIRDTVVQSLVVTYDWDGGSHTLELSFRSKDGALHTFRMIDLSQLEISEDFTSMHVAFCTVLRSPGRVYLSLDPYNEFMESDKDNYCFVGREMAQLPDAISDQSE